MTVRERVWRILDECGPLSARDMAIHLGLDTHRVADACFKLGQRGLVRKTGRAHNGYLYAANGEFVPDLRQETTSAIPCALADAWGWWGGD